MRCTTVCTLIVATVAQLAISRTVRAVKFHFKADTGTERLHTYYPASIGPSYIPRMCLYSAVIAICQLPNEINATLE